MKAKTPNNQHEKTKPLFEFLPGPVKIKDGLFMGDEIAAKDIEFIITNKVTHIINTVSKKIPNLWERFGIHYLSVNWTEKEQNIFDKKNNAVNTIFHFIEEAMQQGESCLIHSVNGKTRSCAVMAAYLIKKYSWSLDKCLEFIASKKQNLEIRNGYMIQLQDLDKRMSQIYNLSSDWKNTKTEQELILKNTFNNSQSPSFEPPKLNKTTQKRVAFVEKPIIHKGSTQSKTHPSHKQGSKPTIQHDFPLKSILKGEVNQDKLVKEVEGDDDSDAFEESKPFKKENNYINKINNINNINGNIVHVTVNNFITSEKKKEGEKTLTNTRPFSSDQKDREKEKKGTNQKKIFPYEANIIGSTKSPYDSKIASRLGGTNTSNNKLQNKPTLLKKQETKNAIYLQRPQSAKHRTTGLNNRIKQQELLVTNTSMGGQKKRYPSNPREQFFKRR